MRQLLRNPVALWSGAVTTLICCFTPVLVGLFTLVGLGAVVGYLDFALMPLLGFFIAALARIYSWRSRPALAWGLGGVVLVGFAIFFGRSNFAFAGLMGVGALASFAYRRRETTDE